jgi:hypothetical protein
VIFITPHDVVPEFLGTRGDFENFYLNKLDRFLSQYIKVKSTKVWITSKKRRRI